MLETCHRSDDANDVGMEMGMQMPAGMEMPMGMEMPFDPMA